MQDRFTMTFNAIGTMAADCNWRWKAPIDCTLIHVSSVVSNAAPAGINIGTSDDTDEFLVKANVGASNAPAEYDFNDFVTYANKAYPRIEKGDTMVVEIDYDFNGGGGASASANLTVVLTFIAG